MRGVLALAAALAFAAPAGATQLQVSRAPFERGGAPALARSAVTGDTVAVWTSGDEVHSATLAAGGRPRTPADRRLAAGARAPDVAAAHSGGFLVVFAAGSTLRGLLLDAEGAPAGAPFDVGDLGARVEVPVGGARVGAAGDGFVVTWVRVTGVDDGLFGRTAIVARRVGTDGALGPEHTLADQGDDPAVAGGLVAWRDRGGTGAAVRARRIGADGAPLADPVTLAVEADGILGPPAVVQAGDRWVTAVLDDRRRLRLNTVTQDGVPSLPAVSGAPGARVHTRPALAASEAGALVVWRARQVRAARLDLSAVAAGAAVRASTGPVARGAGAQSPAAVLAPSGLAMAAWDARLPGSRRAGVLARHWTLGEAFDARPPRVRATRDRRHVGLRCDERCSVMPLPGTRAEAIIGRRSGRRYTVVLRRARSRARLVVSDRAGNARVVVSAASG